MKKNWSYTITKGEYAGKTLWSGRYCAVAAFVFRRIDGVWSVLANKRGSGTPDYQGCWNAVCGFLEADEDSQHGCSREVFEETGYKISPDKFLHVSTHTDPETSNNANVTLRHIAIIFENELEHDEASGGEINEVDEVRWIPIDDIYRYKWAFNHRSLIVELFFNYVYPLEGSSIKTGMFQLLAAPKWLDNNPKIKCIIKNIILQNFII